MPCSQDDLNAWVLLQVQRWLPEQAQELLSPGQAWDRLVSMENIYFTCFVSNVWRNEDLDAIERCKCYPEISELLLSDAQKLDLISLEIPNSVTDGAMVDKIVDAACAWATRNQKMSLDALLDAQGLLCRSLIVFGDPPFDSHCEGHAPIPLSFWIEIASFFGSMCVLIAVMLLLMLFNQPLWIAWIFGIAWFWANFRIYKYKDTRYWSDDVQKAEFLRGREHLKQWIHPFLKSNLLNHSLHKPYSDINDVK